MEKLESISVDVNHIAETFADDVDLHQAISSDKAPDSRARESMAAVMPLALEVLSNHARYHPHGSQHNDDIQEARRQFFTYMRIEDKDHGSHNALQKCKRRLRGGYPRPLNFIRNSSILYQLQCDVGVSMQDEHFFIRFIDEKTLPDMVGMLATYDLSIREVPEALLKKMTPLKSRLQATAARIARLGWPIDLRDVLAKRMHFLDDHPARHEILVSLVEAVGDPSGCVEELYKRGFSADEVREQLSLLASASTRLPMESYLIDVVQGRSLNYKSAYAQRTRLKSAAVRRSHLLELLDERELPTRLGSVITQYFEYAPLTGAEMAAYPTVCQYAAAVNTEPKKSAKKSERSEIIDQQLGSQDLEWLRRLNPVFDPEKDEKKAFMTLKLCNDAMIKGSTSMHEVSVEEFAEIRQACQEFYAHLGWDDPGHPMYHGFQVYLERHANHYPIPFRAVQLIRRLNPIAGDALTALLSTTYCRALDLHPRSIPLREARCVEWAQQRGQTLEQFLHACPSAFVKLLAPKVLTPTLPKQPRSGSRSWPKVSRSPKEKAVETKPERALKAVESPTQQLVDDEPEQEPIGMIVAPEEEVSATLPGLKLPQLEHEKPSISFERSQLLLTLAECISDAVSLEVVTDTVAVAEISLDGLYGIMKTAQSMAEADQDVSLRWLTRQVIQASRQEKFG
ncbi:MAG TPA: hypothetical protein VF733_03420 [Candidatus Saccharimonadales bacterium]